MTDSLINFSVNVVTLRWSDVSSYYPSSESIFVTEPNAAVAQRPLLVFLGIDERGLPSPASGTQNKQKEEDQASKVQKSLPSKETDTGLTPDGKPYFVIDTSHHPELAEKAVKLAGGEQKALFMDLRAELLCLDFDSTGVVAQSRALVDWNKRSKLCCITPMESRADTVPHRPLLCRLWSPNCVCMGWVEARLPA